MAVIKLGSRLTRYCSVVILLFALAVCVYIVYIEKSKVRKVPSNVFCRPEDITETHASDNHFSRSYDTVSISLPDEVVSTVRKFLFFIGYPRSGRSILGNVLDAHPNIIISRNYSLFKKLLTQPTRHKDRSFLFNAIYKNSICGHYFGRIKPVYHRGNIPHFWQGVYNGSVAVIGDESGCVTTALYKLFPNTFVRLFEKLLSVVQIPVYVIHEIQNPYDNIAEMVLSTYQARLRTHELEIDAGHPYDNEALLDLKIAEYFLRADAAFQILSLQVEVVEFHEEDFFQQPKHVLSMVCTALELSCEERYLNTTTRHVLGESQIKSRHLIKWTPEQIKYVHDRVILPYKFLWQYSFDE